METKQKDLRFQKTENSIRSTFFDLLKKKELSDITVTEISRQALLGRGTFYLHYKDIYDLLYTIEKEYVEELSAILDQYLPEPYAEQISPMTDRIFDYIKENKEHLKLLFNHISTRHFTDQLIDQEKKLYCLTTNSPEQRGKNMVKMAFLISGYAGIILDYQFHGTPEISEKEVKKSINEILLPFTRKKQNKG